MRALHAVSAGRSLGRSALVGGAVLTLLLGGCIRKVSGIYQDSGGHVSLDFQGEGKVYAKVFGMPVVADYEEKGNKIIIKRAEGDMFIDILDRDRLSMSHPLSPFTGELRLERKR